MTEYTPDYSLEIKNNEKIVFPTRESDRSLISGKIRYWWCWLAASVLLLFTALPLMLILVIIRKHLWLYPLCLWGARTWLDACGAKVKTFGRENLEADESYIFISNHRSYLDTAALFGHSGRRIGLVAKKELLKAPVFGQGMGFVNIIAIDRSNPEKALDSMRKAKKVLDDGYSFGIFAEGTRAMPGEFLPLKKGAFHLALQTDAPIVPVAIRNTDQMMGKKTGTAYAGTIEMVFLPPIQTEGLTAEKDIDDLIAKTRAAIAEELKRQK